MLFYLITYYICLVGSDYLLLNIVDNIVYKIINISTSMVLIFTLVHDKE